MKDVTADRAIFLLTNRKPAFCGRAGIRLDALLESSYGLETLGGKMMFSRRMVLQAAASAAFALPVLGACRQSRDDVPTVRLFLNWLYTASFAGDVLGARNFADGAGVRLDLQVGGEGRDPIRLVRDGDLGVASADEILRAIALGAPIAIVGVLNDTHPAAFVALRNSGIREPRDFEGKRVGMLPFGATGLVYQSLVSKAGLNRRSIQEVVVTPDLRPFISGRVNDVQPVFMYDEPVSLEQQGIAYTLIDPRQYGVSFKGQCYFATRATIEQQPDRLSRALRALLLGWSRAGDAPQEAIAALRERSPTLDAAGESLRLARALPFFVPRDRRRLLGTTATEWTSMINDLVSSDVIPRAIPPSDFLRLELLERARATRS